MLSPYFIGNGRNLGSVHAATARTFKDMVDRYLNIAVPLNVSREQYAALPDEDQKAAKRTNYLVPAQFRTTPCRRITENALHCNLIFIDLDRDKDGHYPAAAFVNSAAALRSALHPFSFAAYTTASSQPQAPRMRIVIEAHEIPLSKFSKAVHTVFHMLGIKHVTPESCVPIQPMYLPSIFQGDDESMHPLIAAYCEGKAFTIGDIKDVETQDQYHRPNTSVGIDALDYLRPPMQEITLEIAEQALSAIDPDVTYMEWIEIAAALRHQFSPAHDAEAYAIFDKWSKKGKKYVSADETAAKWKSMRPAPLDRAPVTVRSLLRRATTSGWSCAEVKDLCFQATMRWMQNGAQSNSSLMSEGIGRIATTPLISQSEEDALLNQIIIESRRRFGVRVSMAALRRDLKDIKATLRKKRNESASSDQPAFTNGLVYIASLNEIWRHATGERFIPDAVNAAFGKHLLPTEAQLREANLPPTLGNLSRPMVSPWLYLLNHIKIPQAYGVTYDPSMPDDLFTVEGGSAMLNTYVRSHPVADAETGMHAGNVLRRHLERIIAEPEYVRIILDYFAFLVQHPGRKVRWMILFQGAQGCGKSFLIDVMRVVLGAKHVRVVNSETIQSSFNSWVVGAQFLAIEEIRVTGVDRHKVMNLLKAIVSNDNIMVNQKFVIEREIFNRSNVIALTNFKDAIVVEETDRRNCIIQSSIQTKAQVQSLGKDYFENLYAALAEMPGGFRWFFENWRISDKFKPDGHAPTTIYMEQLVENTASEVVSALRLLLREGDLPLVQQDLISSKVLMEVLLAQADINTSRLTMQYLGKVLREHQYENRGRFMIGEERHYIWTKIGEFPKDQKPDEVARMRATISADDLKLL